MRINTMYTLKSFSHWFKVIISLMVVMGVTWIGNVLFFDINLLFIAYIMTILIAGQGVIIFILFVPLSKQVCAWFIAVVLLCMCV